MGSVLLLQDTVHSTPAAEGVHRRRQELKNQLSDSQSTTEWMSIEAQRARSPIAATSESPWEIEPDIENRIPQLVIVVEDNRSG